MVSTPCDPSSPTMQPHQEGLSRQGWARRRALAGSSYPKERIGVVPIQRQHQGIKYRGGLQRTWGERGERGMPGAGLRNGGRRWLPQHISAMPVRADSACMGAFDSVSVCLCGLACMQGCRRVRKRDCLIVWAGMHVCMLVGAFERVSLTQY